MKARRKLALLACVLGLGAANPRTAGAIMAGEGLMWEVAPAAPVTLRVCFLNPADADPLPGEAVRTSGATRREWLRLALKKSWEREARVVFTGWGACENEGSPATPPHTLGPRRPGTADENIKVEIRSTGGGQNPAHGSWGDYQSPSVWLNLHPGAATPEQLRSKIEYLGIHEFGHALGYYHEEERVDWPDSPECPKQTYAGPIPPWWPVPTELRWGVPDASSVMAYCSGRPTELSTKDRAGVQRAYGRHLPGTLLSTVGSLCLSSHATAPNGEDAFGWECDEALDDQEWLYQPASRSLSIAPVTGGARRCLDVDTLDMSTVQTWDCNGWPNQRWFFRRTLLRGYGGLCVARGRGGRVRMRECDPAVSSLRWRVVPLRGGLVRIRAEGTNACLTAPGTVGERVRSATCGRAAGQRFSLLRGGQLQPAGLTGMCLDVRDVWDADYTSGLGGPRGGQVVQLFSCESQQLNQRWGFTGHVVSGNTCLSRLRNRRRNGAPAVMRRCSTSAEQDWDYLW